MVLPMKRLSLFLLLAVLAACTDPTLNAGITLGPGGVSVRPSISTGIEGGGTITYTP
jgi:hypothetical protein